jgi:cyclohexadieny/prephenate dehydrogenase
MKGATVSDVGSVKGSVVRDMAPHLPQRAFRAGASGRRHREFRPDSGFAELFVNRWCILTPPRTRHGAVEQLARSGALGANVEIMPADHHDLVLGITEPSAAPDRLHHRRHRRRAVRGDAIRGAEVLAGGFRDFTRIAASDPTDVARCVPRQQGRRAGDARPLQRGPSALTRAMRSGDGQTLFDHFARTRAIRRGIVEIGQDSPAPDFGRAHPTLPAEPLPRPVLRRTTNSNQRCGLAALAGAGLGCAAAVAGG